MKDKVIISCEDRGDKQEMNFFSLQLKKLNEQNIVQQNVAFNNRRRLLIILIFHYNITARSPLQLLVFIPGKTQIGSLPF